MVYNICQGDHASHRCPKIANAPVANFPLFKNVPSLDGAHRAAFSSIKLGKLPQSVKKMKAERQQFPATLPISVETQKNVTNNNTTSSQDSDICHITIGILWIQLQDTPRHGSLM
ncbi:hypothetical protein J3F84DRAFT_388308 [Trichoderma pleuroticola]